MNSKTTATTVPKKPVAKKTLPKLNQKNSRRGARRPKRNGKQGAGSKRFGSGSQVPGPIMGTVTTSGFSVVNRPLFGYTTRRLIQYYSPGTMTSGASVAGAYVFSANGAFDPDITGTGGQPMGFDQMMIFFNHYTVLRSRIRAVVKNDSTTLRTTAAILTSGSSTVTSVIETAIENGDITFQELEYAGAFGSSCVLTRSVDMARFQGLRFTKDDPDMRGDAASNPAEQVYYHLMVWNSSSATVVAADFQVLIEYDVWFHEPRKGSLS